MSIKPTDVQEYVIVGHLLQVFPVDEEHWEVTVDGEEVSVTCTSTYQAWAIGVAESYRRGKRTRPPPDAERS